jgi:cytidylate kinase
VARSVANKLGFTYIDSGAMYRAVALWAVRNGTALDDMHRLDGLAAAARIELLPGSRVILNGEDVTEAIRTPEISAAASHVSTVPAVRRALVEKQRALAAETSVVMEGRDIGTVVFPHATVKIFLDAEPSTRAGRRALEHASKGQSFTAERAADEIRERDERDRNRTESPLVQSPDAIYVDSTGMPVEEVVQTVLKLIRERVSNGKEFEH